MKKLKPRVTFKKRRRNKMRHSHKMQQQMGGAGFLQKLSSPRAALELRRQNKEKEEYNANQIITLPDSTPVDDLNRIADKNLTLKIRRDASDIIIKTKQESGITDWRNWGKKDSEINKNLMLYFTAYNRIAQIFVTQNIKKISKINDDDAKFGNIKKPMFEFFCKYNTVINDILYAIQEQQNRYNILKILYEHRVAGTLDDAIEDTQLLSETKGLENMSLKEGIKKYSIDTLKLKVGKTEEKISRLNDLIEKNNEDITKLKEGIRSAQGIIESLDRGACDSSVDNISSVDIKTGNSNITFDSPPVANGNNINGIPLVPSMQQNQDDAAIEKSDSSDSDGLEIPVNRSELSLLETIQNIPVKSIESLDQKLIERLTEEFLESINNTYDISTKVKQRFLLLQIYKWLKNKNPIDPDLKIKTKQIFNDISQKISPEDEAVLASGLQAIEEGKNLSQYKGGKRKRKQRGGGKNEILTSLRQFDEAASKQINALPLESYVTFDDKPAQTSIAQGPQLQPGSSSQDPSSIPVSTSTYAPPEQRQIEMEQFNRGQPQSYGSLEEIIERHDAANERQTRKLIEQFDKLAKLIQGRVQGPYQADRGIGTGEEVDVFSSSRSVSEPGSGTEAVNETFSKVDLSKLTSDSYAQTVRYLKLFRAIIEKQNQGKTEEESKFIIEQIDKAIANLQEIISKKFVTIDEETQASLNASGADIAEIMFSMLGIGVTSATLGGKRKRKTLKRMKKYKKSRQVRNTKKRHRKKHR